MGLNRIVLVILALLCLTGPARADTWYRADTHHFTIYSDGSEGQLEDFAHEVERFDALLRMLFRRPAKEDPAKLTIYLVDDAREIDRQYVSGAAGFYSVRLEQTFAVGNREYGADKDDLTGKRVLFHEYAHHFMFHNFAIPAPAWFVEGFAEFVATAEFKRNGEWTFGYPAQHRAYSVRNGPSIPIERLLSEHYYEMTDDEKGSFYGWAWALTHMLYSDPDERGNQIMGYLRDLNNGMDNLEAAEKNFGNLEELEKNLRRYVRQSMPYSKSDKQLPYRDDIVVTKLSDVDSELTYLTLQRLAAKNKDGLREKLQKLASENNSAGAWLQLAELELDAAHSEHEEGQPFDFSATRAATDKALAIDSELARAHLMLGRLIVESFDHDDDTDEANWDVAREHFLDANNLDPKDALALYYYANSFLRQGRRDEMVGPVLESAFSFRPESSEMRSALAQHYASIGDYDSAIYLLKVIANNPHSGDWAKKLIATLEEQRDRTQTAEEYPPEDDAS